MAERLPGAPARSDLLIRTAAGIAMIVVALLCLWLGGLVFAALLVACGVLMAAEWAGLTRNMGAGYRLAVIPYVAIPILALLLLRGRDDGLAITLWTLAVVWSTDIGAYFAGRSIGGPKLAPRISPSKTWAGLLGGVALALFVGATIAAFAGLSRPLLWLGAPMAVLAQAGDLFESWLKRRAGVKDSATWLPGHGGALDRLDGLVPVAALMGAFVWTGWL